MRKKLRKGNSNEIVRAPAYPFSGPQVLQRLRAELTSAFGFQPGFPRLARILGERTNLTHYWFKVMPHQHLIGFLSLLEHLPEPKRIVLLNCYCRELPRLDHPRLAHDAVGVSKLEGLLQKQTGITWIQGGTEYLRTFIITALGHSFPLAWNDAATVAGIDVFEPRKWVPVDSVVYLKGALPVEKARKNAIAQWPAVRLSKSPLILLNGVWTMAAELRGEILDLGLRHHVVVSAPKIPEALPIQAKAFSHIISVSQAREGENRIFLKVEAM